MGNTMKYKGYVAKIEFDAEDGLLIGTVIGTKDLILFECENLNEVEERFHEEIDSYLDVCKALGKEPDKAYSGSYNIRVNPDTHRKAALLAERKGISLNRLTEIAVENYLEIEDDMEKRLYSNKIEYNREAGGITLNNSFGEVISFNPARYDEIKYAQ